MYLFNYFRLIDLITIKVSHTQTYIAITISPNCALYIDLLILHITKLLLNSHSLGLS